jgi:hypothetical protein
VLPESLAATELEDDLSVAATQLDLSQDSGLLPDGQGWWSGGLQVEASPTRPSRAEPSAVDDGWEDELRASRICCSMEHMLDLHKRQEHQA